MGFSSDVEWWEEWQLRILVICSQSVQWILFLSANWRKSIIAPSFRVLIWFAYLGNDAIAIYALAVLFNRHRQQGDSSLPHGQSSLEVVWAPILLMHLGGQDVITAYNMEDNELWRRHVLTAMSQITISIYVFCRSWPGGDERLLQAAIVLFVLGGIRCLEKPFALKSASINSLVSSSDTTARTGNTVRSSGTNSLGQYVGKLSALFQANHEAQGAVDVEPNHLLDQAQGGGDVEANLNPGEAQGAVDVEPNHLLDQAQGEGDVEPNDPNEALEGGDFEGDCLPVEALEGGDFEGDYLPDVEQGGGDAEENYTDEAQEGVYVEDNDHLPDEAQGEADATDVETNRLSQEQGKDQTLKLFVDLASPYIDRLNVTESFLALDEEKSYAWLQERLSDTFDLLYTKEKMVRPKFKRDSFLWGLLEWFRFACAFLPFAAIGLFHHSHKEDYDHNDVKVTYALLACTAAMELLSFQRDFGSKLSTMVSQYNFIGFFARNKRYTLTIYILSSLKCMDYVDQHWCMKASNSASKITILVLRQVKEWWKQDIRNADDYTRFNNHRGQWTIQREGCSEDIGWSMRRSFDESVLLWHIATDLCFYKMDQSPSHACNTDQNDEAIFIAGCATWCTRSAHHVRATGCREISNYMMYLLFAKPEMLMAGTRRNLFIAAYGRLMDILENQEQQPLEEKAIAQNVIVNMESSPREGFVSDAWDLSQKLLELDERKRWEVIEGVWVEMLCFSASRCRGYLHAKSLGTGGELLTFVWLLWSHMGMETLAERMQMTGMELPSDGGGHASAVHLANGLITNGNSLAGDIGEDQDGGDAAA